MQFNFKKRILFFSVGILIFSCLAFLFVYKKIGHNNKVAEQVQSEWQAEAIRREEAKSLDRTMKSIEAERALLETHFAKSSDIVPFLDTLEGLATKTGAEAEVSSVDVLKDEVGLMVGLKATGSFSEVYKFLMLLENSPYELEFSSIDFQTRVSQDLESVAVPTWNAVFKIKLLSFIP